MSLPRAPEREVPTAAACLAVVTAASSSFLHCSSPSRKQFPSFVCLSPFPLSLTLTDGGRRRKKGGVSVSVRPSPVRLLLRPSVRTRSLAARPSFAHSGRSGGGSDALPFARRPHNTLGSYIERDLFGRKCIQILHREEICPGSVKEIINPLRPPHSNSPT